MAVKMASKGVQEHLAAGDEAHAACRWSDAIEHYTCAKDALRNDAERLGQLGFAYSQMDRYTEARSVFEELALKQPAQAKWPYMVGYQYYDASDWRNALEWFEKALELRPDYLIVHFRAAHCREQIGQFDKALGHLFFFVESVTALTQERQAEYRSKLQTAHVRTGRLLLKKGLPRPAIRSLLLAVELYPQSGEAHYWLGKAYLSAGECESAADQFEQAQRVLGCKDYIMAVLAEALTKIGRYADAHRAYDMIPGHCLKPYMVRQIAELHLLQGNVNDAVSMLERCTKRDPQNHRTRFVLAQAYVQKGELRLALQQLQQAIDLKMVKYGRPFAEAQQFMESIGVDVGTSADASSVLRPANIGRVETYNAKRGFGFIRAMSGDRIFLHCTDWPDPDLPSDQTVEYTVVSTPKGLRAHDIKVLDTAKAA